MTDSLMSFPNPEEVLSRTSALVAGPTHGVIISPDGEVEEYDHGALRRKIRGQAFLICNPPVIARRLGMAGQKALDVLELFAFVRPAQFCLPLPRGLARALKIEIADHSLEDEGLILIEAARRLIREIAAPNYPYPEGLLAQARQMAEAGWSWGPLILGALKSSETATEWRVWDHLPEWEEEAPPAPPGTEPVGREEAIERLGALIGANAEQRESQKDYTALAAHTFDPPETAEEPVVVLAEAGTGIGKTLGYIAPASLWAEKNDGTVWISTYTKNLQRQLDQELDRLYPDPATKARKAVIRKGRENYLCLLNLQELSQSATQNEGRILLGLVQRWARYSRDGDMIGGDFPSWLGEHFGQSRLAQLTDRRGECIYAACAHYKRCFIEKSRRRSRKASLVIANHALVMIQAATRTAVNKDGKLESVKDPDLPSRYIFDEGHHIFDAADSAFSAHLSGQEGLDLRRWVRGAENSKRRGRGLEGRLEELVAGDDEARSLLQEVIHAARCLPADGWHGRLIDGSPFGPAEHFLAAIRQQLYARNGSREEFHSIECPPMPPVEGLPEAAEALQQSLKALVTPMKGLSARLLKKLDQEADELDSASRNRLESLSQSISRRRETIEFGWIPMLDVLAGHKAPDEEFIDWFELDRQGGREVNVGFYRHWVDPSLPFASTVLKSAQGSMITSATLRDRLTENHNPDVEWHTAEVRTGAAHLISPPLRQSLNSPFDYPAQSRIFIVNDMNKRSLDQLAAAYRELFLAAGGGALGLFTAISRLRGVYQRLAGPLEDEGLPLYAQHIDPINVATLVDIFREVEHSCLLGTDAVRDGMDVPGPSLRLCVFDKVPWPRPTLLHKARRKRFGGQSYDDLITRLRLKQAYGRLIRRQSDRGVFVMLDGATPSRLLSAFPEGVEVERIGLAEAIQKTKEFLSET
ncbi:ATP-dependent DNA helicase [Emcibacter sp.]|uniref:ATP-dependent DNA helicase n=1 Tax=Emcibacter sp. TaxID=1979954 RepID=UPI002AA85B83|nr:ATP-dependent DNA helicase [Emcibacter sp.]